MWEGFLYIYWFRMVDVVGCAVKVVTHEGGFQYDLHVAKAEDMQFVWFVTCLVNGLFTETFRRQLFV
jgi:hypothetical protein